MWCPKSTTKTMCHLRRTSTKNPQVPILETWHAPAFLPQLRPTFRPGTSLLAKQQEAGQWRVAQHVTIWPVTLCTLRKIGSSTPKKRLLMIALVVFPSAWTCGDSYMYVSLQIRYVQSNFASTSVKIENRKVRIILLHSQRHCSRMFMYHCDALCPLGIIVFASHVRNKTSGSLLTLSVILSISIQSLHCLFRASQLWMKASWINFMNAGCCPNVFLSVPF